MCFFRTTVLVFALSFVCCAQTQNTPQTSATVQTKTIPVASPPLPPSSDDAPIPDRGAVAVPNQSSSPIKRALRRLDPNCFDGIFHLCWSSPVADEPVYTDYEKRRIAEDLELGDYAMKHKNYRGAEFRFEDALTYAPENAEATFKLAEAHNKLGHKAEACSNYNAYLKIAPSGAFADRARTGLAKLMPCPSPPIVE